jgi:hypothetical protein
VSSTLSLQPKTTPRVRTIWTIALTVSLAIGLVACGGTDQSRDRNTTLSTASTLAKCATGGTLKVIAGQKSICAVTKTGKFWYPVAKQKTWLCSKLGIVRLQGDVYAVCGKAGKKKFWNTTLPLSPEAIAAGFVSSTLTALIDAGDVPAPS